MGVTDVMQGESIVFILGKLCQLLTIYFKIIISKKFIFCE